MVIYELGLLNCGLPLIAKQYYKEYNMNVDPLLRGGFLSALNAFAEEVFSDQIDSFSLKNFKIVLLSRPFRPSSQENIIAYCIGDNKLKLETAKKALTKVLDVFFTNYGYLTSLKVDLGIFSDFLPVFDEIVGDLAKKPEDRLRSVFG
jgi:hypothetical protein